MKCGLPYAAETHLPRVRFAPYAGFGVRTHENVNVDLT